MPSFVIPLTRHPNLLNNMKRDEQAQLEETVKWLRKSKTQQFDQLNEDGQQEVSFCRRMYETIELANEITNEVMGFLKQG